ncbi:uncharacterized protein LOC128559082 [Mercenaria mercenaria]|uniref:uncharacterized protein LOC128559082 n=1 Tax=Mercenaria mercenaria TaxID=6596 RepID=UPI00234F260B|nr:uncharacterized protein LOC128559082 [Mercenaria mercenaria]
MVERYYILAKEKREKERKHQSGKEYVSLKGNCKQRRNIKLTKDCEGRCRFGCENYFIESEIEDTHKQFWCLNEDMNGEAFRTAEPIKNFKAAVGENIIYSELQAEETGAL